MKKLINWIKGIFSKTQRLFNKFIPIAVDIVQGVKKAISSNTLDVIANVLKAILPDVADSIIDLIVKYLTERIPALCIQLEIIEAVNLSDKTEEAVKQALSALQETYGEKWDEFMSTLAGDLVNYLSDGKLDAKEAKELAGKFYDEYIKNN